VEIDRGTLTLYPKKYYADCAPRFPDFVLQCNTDCHEIRENKTDGRRVDRKRYLTCF
jgi:hypothetical protein